MNDICIITTENRRLYPAKVYDTTDNQLTETVESIDNIYDVLYRRQSILVISNQYDQQGNKLNIFHGQLEKGDIKAMFAVNDEEDSRSLNSVMTLSEAAKKWGLSDGSTIRKAIEKGKFQKDEIKQAGDVWITTYSSMERVFGNIKNEENEYIIYDDFENAIFKLYLADASLDYARGEVRERKLKENEEAYQYIKEVFVKALNAVRNNRKIIIKKSRNNKVRQIINTEKELFMYLELLPWERVMTVKRNQKLLDDLKAN